MLRFRILLLLCFTLPVQFAFTQVADDFSDGNFTANPAWAGDNPDWEVLAGELHLNGIVGGGVSHLSTPSTAMSNAVWEFNLRLDFNPSGANYVEVFLASDIANLEGTASGYLVRLGNTTDEVSLYYVNGGSKSEIIDGIDDRLDVSNPKAKVRVLRDNLGNWQLFSDTTGTGNNYVLEGTTLHNTVTSSAYFGVSTLYSSTRRQWCYLDSIDVTAAAVVDTFPPTISSVIATSTNTAQVTWSEIVDLTTAENTLNYLRNGAINPTTATVEPGDSTKINLNFGANTFGICASETLVVSNVEDRLSNVMVTDTVVFNYLSAGVPAYKTVIINEIMADPSPAPACVPAFEYIEIYNRDTIPVDLQNWTISDNGAPRTITTTSFPLCPGEYALLVSNASNFIGYNNVIAVPSFPGLTNSGERLVLHNDVGTTIDSLFYSDTWYQDGVKAAGGWSLELINTTDLCATSSNWIASNDACGGTPGAQNSVFSSVPDVTGPVITTVTVTGANTLTVCFDEGLDNPSANNASNYVVSNGFGSPTTASIVGPSFTCVDLTFAAPFDTAFSYTLTATGIEDCKGNTAPTTGNFFISGPTAFKSVIFNEVFPDPDTTATALPNAEFVELYNRSANPLDLNGWTFSDASSTQSLGSYLLQPGAYVLICAYSDTALYTGLPYLGLTSLPSLNNTGDELGLRDASGILIDTLEYPPVWYNDPLKENGGWTIELINPNDTCNVASNWRASVDPDGGTPGAVNSVYSIAPDTTAPVIISAVVTGTNTVEICFSESVTQASGGIVGNYSVDNGLGTPSTASPIGPGFSCVTLTFATAIDTGTLYTVTVTNLEDCNNNTTPSTGNFILAGPAPFRTLIFNEIFADPDSTVTALPNAEYVEIYNRSGQLWNLAGWSFSDAGSPKTLGGYNLSPGAYVILCSNADTAKYSGLPYLGLSSFPSLNNSGDAVGLRDPFGTLVDSVEYTLATYQDNVKEDGGWSLELINPDDTCSLLGNWIASNDANGGTPGAQNSVYDNTPDVTVPTIVSAVVTSFNSVELCFDETMDLTALLNTATYSIDNGMGNPVSATASGVGNACVTLDLVMPIDTGTVYTVTITNVGDCKGNIAPSLTTTFVLGGNAVPFQVVINEILPDYSEVVSNLPEAEYIELYNTGSNVVSLENWIVTDRRDDGTVGAYNLFPGGYVVLCSTSDVSDFQAIGVNAVGVSGFPGLNNDGDSLEIHDATGALIDFAYYNDSWYHDEDKEDDGWSIERKDPTFICANGDNWAASTDPQGGTPERVNSVDAPFIDQTPPEVVGVVVTSRTTITVTFSEQMDYTSLLDKANYNLDGGIGEATQALVGSLYPFTVDLTFGSLMDTSLIYCLRVTDVMDCPGNTIGTPNEFCFGIAEPMAFGDLIINEILFNPYSGGADFVELYNNSNKILDLAELNIAEVYPGNDSIYNSKEVTSTQRVMLPHTYVCLTAKKQVQIDTYQPIDPAAIFEMSSFPSYDDAEGTCVIYTNDSLVMDSLHYLDDWSFPNLDDKNGVSLERLDFNRITQDEDNWHSAASTVNYATPGYKNSETLVPEGEAEVWLQPETFSPDQDGFEDILSINYHFREPDWNVRVGIFDNKGRLVRMLKENTLVGTEQGTWIWDGTTDGLHKADIGVYVVLLEAVNPSSGETKSFKLGCVLATRY